MKFLHYCLHSYWSHYAPPIYLHVVFHCCHINFICNPVLFMLAHVSDYLIIKLPISHEFKWVSCCLFKNQNITLFQTTINFWLFFCFPIIRPEVNFKTKENEKLNNKIKPQEGRVCKKYNNPFEYVFNLISTQKRAIGHKDYSGTYIKQLLHHWVLESCRLMEVARSMEVCHKLA